MGRRSSTETLARILVAFMRRRRWTQKALADECGISVPALRKRLLDLESAGVPFVSEACHPHVEWRVPAGWAPAGVLVPKEDVPDLLRLLTRMPRTRARDAVLRRLVGFARVGSEAIVPPVSTQREDAYLGLVEDAAAGRVPLAMDYFSASRGDAGRRWVSVHRVHVGPPARFLAVCHRDGALKWFRVENVLTAAVDEAEKFRPASAERLSAHESASIRGFRGPGDAVECVFRVRSPECRWVERNLPVVMAAERVGDGVRFSVTTAAVVSLARFVVGLGGAARAETPELASAVQGLAEGALERPAPPARAAAPARRATRRPVATNRATG